MQSLRPYERLSYVGEGAQRYLLLDARPNPREEAPRLCLVPQCGGDLELKRLDFLPQLVEFLGRLLRILLMQRNCLRMVLRRRQEATVRSTIPLGTA